MSAPYDAQDVRNILEAFVAEFLVDIPAIGVQTIDGAGHNLLFSESTLVASVFLADDEWVNQVVEFLNEDETVQVAVEAG